MRKTKKYTMTILSNNEKEVFKEIKILATLKIKQVKSFFRKFSSEIFFVFEWESSRTLFRIRHFGFGRTITTQRKMTKRVFL